MAASICALITVLNGSDPVSLPDWFVGFLVIALIVFVLSFPVAFIRCFFRNYKKP